MTGKDHPSRLPAGEENSLDNEESVLAMINSRKTFVPPKTKNMDTVHPVKVPLKRLC